MSRRMDREGVHRMEPQRRINLAYRHVFIRGNGWVFNGETRDRFRYLSAILYYRYHLIHRFKVNSREHLMRGYRLHIHYAHHCAKPRLP